MAAQHVLKGPAFCFGKDANCASAVRGCRVQQPRLLDARCGGHRIWPVSRSQLRKQSGVLVLRMSGWMWNMLRLIVLSRDRWGSRRLLFVLAAVVCAARMSPKKKLKVSPGCKTLAIAAGEDTALAASSMKDVHEFQLLLEKWVDAAHAVRNQPPGRCGPVAPLKLSDSQPGEYQWPVCSGGTLKEIAQRAWMEPERLLAESARMACAAGLLATDDSQDFLNEFCVLPESGLVKLLQGQVSDCHLGI